MRFSDLAEILRRELGHDLAGIEAQRVDRWIDAVGDWSRGESAMARRLVADFLAFERTGVVVPKVRQDDLVPADLES